MRMNWKVWSRRLVVGSSVAAMAWLAAPAIAGIVCYKQSVTGWSQVGQPGGGCSTYSNCPDRILCAEGSMFQYSGTIALTNVDCTTYSGGTWDPVKKACTGGMKVPPQYHVTIYVQLCSGVCN